ncbi:MAG: T9SS C-terminal target domain-containing protein [Chlorobi bacterium CHB2]|nr:T9SS C-terminal target domain-containing protein [Chlorobi bacterium CHB2]
MPSETAPQTRTWTFHDAVRSMGPTIDGTQLTVPSGMLVEGNILPPGSVLKGTVTFKVTNENDQGKLPGDENYPEITFDNNNKLPIKFEDCHLVVLAHMNDGNNYGEILQGVKAPFPTGGPTGAIISQTTSKWQATIKPSETASYTTTIKNLTDAPQELAVTRTQNNLPTGWSSYMKLGSTQLDPGTSSGNITLPPGASIAVQLYVTGTTEKSNGTVTLQFQAGATTLNQSYTTTTTESEPSSGVNDQPTTGVGMTLSANLPNPAATTTTFSYSLLQSGEVTVNVIGMNGEKVMTLNPGFAEAGLHTLRLDVSTLPAGSYIVTLSSNGRSASRSMTVVH